MAHQRRKERVADRERGGEGEVIKKGKQAFLRKKKHAGNKNMEKQTGRERWPRVWDFWCQLSPTLIYFSSLLLSSPIPPPRLLKRREEEEEEKHVSLRLSSSSSSFSKPFYSLLFSFSSTSAKKRNYICTYLIAFPEKREDPFASEEKRSRKEVLVISLSQFKVRKQVHEKKSQAKEGERRCLNRDLWVCLGGRRSLVTGFLLQLN